MAESNLELTLSELRESIDVFEEHKLVDPNMIYPWDPRNFPENIDNLYYSADGIREIPPKFHPRKEQVYISQKVDELSFEYAYGKDEPRVIYQQSFLDIIRPGDQEQYFKSYTLPIEGCQMAPIEFNETGQSGFETNALSGEIAIKNRNLLDRIGAVSPALGLMLERPAAIVMQSAFIKRLEAQIKYEIEKCECSEPGYSMSWLFEMIRSNSITSEEPELVINQEPDEKMIARFKIYQKALISLCLHFENLRPILLDIKRNYETVLVMRTRQINEMLVVKKSIEHYEKLLDNKREKVQADGYILLNELQQQIILLMAQLDKQDSVIRTMTEMLLQIEKSLVEENDLRKQSEERRKLLIIEVNELKRKYGLGPAAGTVATAYRIGSIGKHSDGSSPPGSESVDISFEEGILNSEDPVFLRTTLENTRKALSEAHRRIMIFEADFSDVIPVEDYNVVKVEADRLLERDQKTSETYKTLSTEVDGLRQQIHDLKSDCIKLNDTLHNLETRPTARPSWARIGGHFMKIVESENPEEEWHQIYDGNSTEVICQKLVERITGQKVHKPVVVDENEEEIESDEEEEEEDDEEHDEDFERIDKDMAKM